jgi:hypothetical protein
MMHMTTPGFMPFGRSPFRGIAPVTPSIGAVTPTLG